MPTRSVIVAGRRPTMLLSLKRLLDSEFEVAAMADNVLSLVHALDEIDADLLVLDVGSVEFGAGDLAPHLQQRHPEVCIVLVGDDASGAESSYPPGCAYVSKHAASESLVPVACELLARAGAEKHARRSE